LNHTFSPFCSGYVFGDGLSQTIFLAWLSTVSPDLSLPSSLNYSHEPLAPAVFLIF
jgi:hypothetical protein